MTESYKIGLGLFGLLILSLIIGPMDLTEGFTPLSFKSEEIKNPGEFPLMDEQPLLSDTYKYKGKNQVSKNGSQNNWWRYPTFTLPSFEQITNNIRYNNSPDNGKVSRAEFAGAMYKEQKNKSNIVKPLPPAQEGEGARVGYYRAEPNELFYSIPTNENILY